MDSGATSFNVLGEWRRTVQSKLLGERHVGFVAEENKLHCGSIKDRDSVVLTPIANIQQGTLNYNHMFDNLIWVSDVQFMEELQYTLISSPFLNDIHHHQMPLSVANSIMDFHRDRRFHRESFIFSVPTKLGYLKARYGDKKLELRKNINFMDVHKTVYSILKHLRNNNKKCTWRILSVLMIILYIGYEQAHFHNQYPKYSFLTQLKAMMGKLQQFDSIQRKYFENINITKEFDKTGNEIFQLLHSITHIASMKLYHLSEFLLRFTNIGKLSKYCGVYGIDMNLAYLTNVRILTSTKQELHLLQDKIEFLRKFLLCCFLSVEHQDYNEKVKNTIFSTYLLKLFPGYTEDNNCKSLFSSQWSVLSTVIVKFNQDLSFLYSVLNENKELIYSTETREESETDEMLKERYKFRYKDKNQSLMLKALSQIHLVEEQLISVQDADDNEETKCLINDHIKNLQQLILCCNNKTNSGTNFSNRHTSLQGKGLFLDVLKSPEEKFTPIFQEMQVSRIGIKNVSDNDDLESILTDNENYEHIEPAHFIDDRNNGGAFTIYEDSTCYADDCYKNVSELRKLNDEQLRRKLNEKIQLFATENKKNRNQIRQQKSLELLRSNSTLTALNELKSNTNYESLDKGVKTKKRAHFMEQELYSEETIPFYYEINDFLYNQANQ